MPLGHKLSEIKTKINSVIANLELLEGLSNGPHNDFDSEQSLQLERCTTRLLSQLTEIPCEKIARIQKQRKRRRQKVKEKAKLEKFLNKATSRDSKGIVTLSKTDTASAVSQKQAEHITLKKLHDATNILHTLDLLETLYKVRGGDKDLAQKLANIRNVWQRVQQESKIASAPESPISNKRQWAKVIFGSDCYMKHSKSEFLERRIIWDSYISYGKRSSCIPGCWVLPPEKPTAEWAQFKCE